MSDEPRLTGERHDRSADEEARELAAAGGPIASTKAPGGQLGSASGGYGSRSDVQSSSGTGEGTDEASGGDEQTEWLRDAPGGGGER